MKHSINCKINPPTQSNRPRLRQGLTASRRKQWGNTLVPVVIGIAITAVATASFLNQGKDLQANNKTMLASTELSSMLTDWVLLASAKGTTAIVDGDKPASFSRANIFGSVPTFTAATSSAQPTLLYNTDSSLACDYLEAIFTANIEGLTINSECGSTGDAARKLTLTLIGAKASS